MDLRELDLLETARHSFEIIELEKKYDWWECRLAIDGVRRERMIVPHKDIVDRGLRPNSPEFEAFIKAQCLAAPVEHAHG